MKRVVMCSLLFSSAYADEFRAPTWSLDLGFGTSVITMGTEEYRWATSIGFEVNWPARITKIQSWENIEFREFASARWLITDAYGRGDRPFDAGWLCLGFRWQYLGNSEYSPYFEFGSGFVYVDHLVHDLTTNFNFGSFAGIGVFLHSLKGSPRLGLRFVHISNAGTGGSNGGVNLLQGVIGVRI